MTRSQRSRNVCAALVLLGTVIASGCATSIRKITLDPSKYTNREVKVSGQVVDDVSLGGRGAYRIDDGTGTLWVVSDGGVPRRGARVRTTGRIRDAFDISIFGGRISLPGGLNSGLVMVESSHDTK